MKVIVIGSGGREHAITWRIKQDCHELFAQVEVKRISGNESLEAPLDTECKAQRMGSAPGTDRSGMFVCRESTNPALTSVAHRSLTHRSVH